MSGVLRGLPVPFRKKIIQEEVSQLGFTDSVNKFQRHKKGPGRQVQGVSLG